jgi:hypothetical protein
MNNTSSKRKGYSLCPQHRKITSREEESYQSAAKKIAKQSHGLIILSSLAAL